MTSLFCALFGTFAVKFTKKLSNTFRNFIENKHIFFLHIFHSPARPGLLSSYQKGLLASAAKNICVFFRSHPFNEIFVSRTKLNFKNECLIILNISQKYFLNFCFISSDKNQFIWRLNLFLKQ